jgi:hypothetical protein
VRLLIILAAVALAGCEPGVDVKAKRVVSSKLKDPDSAKFRDLRDVGSAICGEVNGRNGYGAYAGYHPFVFFPSDGAVFFIRQTMPKKDKQAWAHFCNPQVPAAERIALFERTPQGIQERAHKETFCRSKPQSAYCLNVGDVPLAYGPSPSKPTCGSEKWDC